MPGKIFLPLALCAAIFAATVGRPARAEAPVTVRVQASWDDVTFELSNAITNAGLVVDRVNDVGAMLERTKEALGKTRRLYTHASVYNFCSAKVSRMVMAADPDNLQFCPYKIFAYETPDAPGTVVVGHPRYPAGVTDAVNRMLDRIIKDATAGL